MPIHELIPFRPGLNKLKNSQSVYTWNWPAHAKQNKLSMDRASLPVFILLLIQQRRYLATGIVEAKKAQKPKISEKWRLHNLDSYFLQQNTGIVFLSSWCGFLVWKKKLFSSQCKWRMISRLPLLNLLALRWWQTSSQTSSLGIHGIMRTEIRWWWLPEGLKLSVTESSEKVKHMKEPAIILYRKDNHKIKINTPTTEIDWLKATFSFWGLQIF